MQNEESKKAQFAELRKALEKTLGHKISDHSFKCFKDYVRAFDDEDEDEGVVDTANDDNTDDDIQMYMPYAQCDGAEYLPSTSLKKFTLRVTLNRIRPEIWRELEVPSSLRLTSLAGMIITAMGWNEHHLHHFVTKDREIYVTSFDEEGLQDGEKDGIKSCIGDLLKRKGSSVLFEYDFGDDWEHKVALVSQEEYADNEKKEVKLLDGKRSCPPEDCGGIYGYQELCEAMKHPNSSQAKELTDWLDSKFDPEYFPLDEAKEFVDNFNKQV